MALLNLSGGRRIPLLRQAEAAECGLACIGMVAAAHGFRTDLPSLRRQFAISLKGATLKDIIAIGSEIGLGARAVRCEPDELRQLRTPAILHWNLNHFVVLSKASRKAIEILDPARGQMTLTLAEAGQHFTGVALELTPTPAFQKKRETNPVKLFSLVKFDSTAWKAVAQALALSVFLQVFVLLGPYYMQLVIDEAILKGDLSLLTAVAVGFGLLKVFEALTTVLRGLVLQFLSSVLGFDMQASLFRHMIRLPLPFFHRRPDRDRIRQAAEMASVHDEIEAMPMGYRSLVGDMGTTLSGGQQQRVMLARALYRQPRILVLDEGTSALDIGTERRVNAALKSMGITRIIAAHRPETLASADRVVGLQDGRLVPVKFELRAVSAAEPAETTKPAKDHYTDGIGLKRGQFET